MRQHWGFKGRFLYTGHVVEACAFLNEGMSRAERLADENIHVGPSDYIPWLHDNKLCFLRLEGNQFGDVPMTLELRLSVEDSPNSAACVVDAIRCVKLGMERGVSGALNGPSAYFCKHPRTQMTDDLAQIAVENFIAGA